MTAPCLQFTKTFGVRRQEQLLCVRPWCSTVVTFSGEVQRGVGPGAWLQWLPTQAGLRGLGAQRQACPGPPVCQMDAEKHGAVLQCPGSSSAHLSLSGLQTPGKPEPLTLQLAAGPSRLWPTSSFSKRWCMLVTSTGARRKSVRNGFAHLTDSDLWEQRAQAAEPGG